MKWWQKLIDYSWCYMMAWVLILAFPIWLPIWLAVKIYKYGKIKDVYDENSKAD